VATKASRIKPFVFGRIYRILSLELKLDPFCHPCQVHPTITVFRYYMTIFPITSSLLGNRKHSEASLGKRQSSDFFAGTFYLK
ncbi:MAG: hypothetical protein ACFE7R_08055, partial [Candidatus Hodarchaeota archaeon]